MTVEGLTLTPVINAAGALTPLGGSICRPETAHALADASRRWVDMTELMDIAGKRIAAATGAEAGFVTNCAAAGLTISAAAVLTAADPTLAGGLPHVPAGRARQLALQGPHAISFGAPLTQVLGLSGVEVVEAGTPDACGTEVLRHAVQQSIGLVHVVSHHVDDRRAVSLPNALAVARNAGVPLIVDVAAETDLRKYIAAGADLVVYSGHKAIRGPTSGLVAGRADLIEACRAQNNGIGRTMKIGKESIVGLLIALDSYLDRDPEAAEAELRHRNQLMLAELRQVDNIVAEVAADASRPIERVRVRVSEASPVSATAVVRRLRQRTPSVHVRAHHVADGWFELDPRGLTSQEATAVGAAVREQLQTVHAQP